LVRSVCVSALLFIRLCCTKIRRKKTKKEKKQPYTKLRSGWSEIGGAAQRAVAAAMEQGPAPAEEGTA
jgi:hypothetical protein